MSDQPSSQDPQEEHGEPVKVARASNQAEAEMLQGLLQDSGIPSLLQRSAGADAPQFLAAGARDIMVPASKVDEARSVLQSANVQWDEAAGGEDRPKGDSEAADGSSGISDTGEIVTAMPAQRPWVKVVAATLVVLFILALLSRLLFWS
jgi:hypothetical protein